MIHVLQTIKSLFTKYVGALKLCLKKTVVILQWQMPQHQHQLDFKLSFVDTC